MKPLMVDLLLLLIGSILIIYFSRKSFSRPLTHGFYRFLAWEIILIQFVLNLDSWFSNALSWYQCISWFLLSDSIIFLIEGVRSIKKYGASANSFENTTRLVKTGIYRLIRHPMYASLLFLTWGIFCKSPSMQDLGFSIITTLFLLGTARLDEKESISKFGKYYVEYMKQTKLFIPYIF